VTWRCAAIAARGFANPNGDEFRIYEFIHRHHGHAMGRQGPRNGTLRAFLVGATIGLALVLFLGAAIA